MLLKLNLFLSIGFKKLAFFLGLLFFAFQGVFAQINLDSTKLMKVFEANVKYIQADEIGNLYIVSPTNQLYKYNSKGVVLATLNYNYTGSITSIDVSNPMEIYVFYKEINRVVFLDNNLSYRGEIDLSKSGISQASAIARSYDNGVWIFDLGDLQLKKMNKDGEILQSSGNIKQFSKVDFTPSYLFDNTNLVTLSNDSICLLFDVFAAYIKTIKLSSFLNVYLGNEVIYKTMPDGVFAVNLTLPQVKKIYQFKSPNQVRWSFVSKDEVYVLMNNQILVYKR